MSIKLTAALAAAALAMSLGTGAALSKAHDQGRADGTFNPDAERGARDAIDALTDLGVLDGNGVSALTKGGARGAVASDGKGGAD